MREALHGRCLPGAGAMARLAPGRQRINNGHSTLHTMLGPLRNILTRLQPPVALEGTVAGRPWMMSSGAPTRDYVKGRELRARAELRIDDEIAVLVMNRFLKSTLEGPAYDRYIDTDQTLADASMPEELRWLATYEEVRGGAELPREFLRRYAVLAAQGAHALAWIDEALIDQLMNWPHPGPGAEVPFMLMLLRGKAYLRMQHEPMTSAVAKHASALFTHACESAVKAFAPKA